MFRCTDTLPCYLVRDAPRGSAGVRAVKRLLLAPGSVRAFDTGRTVAVDADKLSRVTSAT
jgi:hypothetical protein